MPSENNNNQTTMSYPSTRIAWTTVLILSATYMFSMLDRQILVLLIEPIKQDLNITDTQVSLLTGFAFALVYTFMGVPMGRVADLWVRKYVIIFGVTIWSLLTIASGFTKSFWQLFAARMGVGFGEAALTPTAYALIPDLFPPNKLARAMSVFVLGGTAIGGGMSLLLGGYVIGHVESFGAIPVPFIGELRPWQLVLVVVGLLSLLMVIPLALLKEPARHIKTSNGKVQDISQSFSEVLVYMWQQRAFYLPFAVGAAIANLVAYGMGAWIPSYFIRVHGWDAASTGMTIGALYIVPALIGGLLGGWLSDDLYNRGYKGAPLYLMVATLSLALLSVLLFIYIPSVQASLLFLIVLYFLVSLFFVLFPTVIQMATPNRMRAQVSAIHLLIGNLIGIGFGPTSVALITDYYFQDEMAVGHSMAIVGFLGYGLAVILLGFSLKPFLSRQNSM